MASEEACRAAITQLCERLATADSDVRAHVEDRTISCRLSDLEIVLSGELRDGELVDVTTRVQAEPAQIRLVCSSDDLIDLVAGGLSFPHAWATGRVKLNASIRDLYKLRTLLG